MKMPWFRMYHESRNDRKLDTLADDEFRVWHKLLCMASDQDERGTIEYDDLDLLAIEVARGDVTLLSRTVTRLVTLKIVTDDGHALIFRNFVRRNYDRPSDTPEATRERKRKSRANAKETGQASANVTHGHASSRVRGEEIREEKSKEEYVNSLIGEGVQGECESGADAPPPHDEPIPIKRASRNERATRIPADFPITERMAQWASEKVPDLDLDYAHEEFCTYWRGKGGTNVDWEQTWRNGMLKAYERRRQSAPRYLSQADLNSGKRRKFVGA